MKVLLPILTLVLCNFMLSIHGYTCYPEITLSTNCPTECGNPENEKEDFDSTCLYFPLGRETTICNGANATQYDYNCVSNASSDGCTVGCHRWNRQWSNLKRVYHFNLGVHPWISAVEKLRLVHAPRSPTQGFFLKGLPGNSIQFAPEFLRENPQLLRISLTKLTFGSLEAHSLPMQLEHLEVNHCNLSIFPSDLGEMPALATLSLANNQLKQIPASIGHRFGQLKRLDLSYNQFISIPWILEKMPGLFVFIFTGNPFSHWVVSKTLFNILSQLKLILWEDFVAPSTCPEGTAKLSFTTPKDQLFTFCVENS